MTLCANCGVLAVKPNHDRKAFRGYRGIGICDGRDVDLNPGMMHLHKGKRIGSRTFPNKQSSDLSCEIVVYDGVRQVLPN
jgi:hypothetical protein